MKTSPWRLVPLIAAALMAPMGCSTVEPAGSLGYIVDGETRFRPVPRNYRHVPPQMEASAPQFKVTF